MKYAMIATWKMSYDGVVDGLNRLNNNEKSSDVIITSINKVEENENFHSVGYSGLPNEEGVVQCDAGFMDGSTLKFGAVGALENVVHAVDVAKLCSKDRFNNVLVGDGANQFARNNGFKVENMTTEESTQMYLKRKNEDKELSSYDGHDTVGMVCLDSFKNMCAATSTSGLFMKKKGRVGDSPLIGSGFYCDDEIGGVTATGVGEEIMRGCLSYEVIRRMKEGMSPMFAASSTVYEWTNKMIKTKGYCDAISIICMNNKGEYGVGTNIKFAFTYGSETIEPEIYVAIPYEDSCVVRRYDSKLDELD